MIMSNQLLQLFALGADHLVRERGHPKTSTQCRFLGLVVVLGAGVDESEKALHDRSRGTVSFKVDQWFALTDARYLRWLLRVVRQVVDIQGCPLLALL